MNKNMWPALIVTILIIGSVIGGSIVTSSNDGNNQTPTPTPAIQRIQFEASSVDANVERMLRVVRLQGYTSETNMDAILSRLIRIDGIESFQNAPFFGQPDRSREDFLPFFVDFLAAENTDFIALGEAIEDDGIISDVSFIGRALLRIPQKITIVSSSKDLNLQRDYNFSQPFLEGFVGITAVQGDMLKINIELELTGDQIVSLDAYEVQNISAQPVSRSAEVTAEIVSLSPELAFEGSILYGGFSAGELEEELSEIADANNAEVNLNAQSREFTIDFNTQGLETEQSVLSLEQDINAALSGIEGISGISFSSEPGKLSALISFASLEGFAALREQAFSAFEEAGLSERVSSVENPFAQISGKIEFSHNSLGGAAEKVSDALLSRNLGLTVFQPAELDVNSLRDIDSNEEFFSGEAISARLLPGHSTGEKVEAVVAFYTQRETIVLAQANEKTE